MTFAEIIRDNVDHHCPVKWWAKCAFHFTDILNAQSILESGYLYSRVSAEKQHVMANDNAGRQVIDLTAAAAKSKVRFYFRPLTPTQYYNEGFKHQKLQFDEANVPVPVFFLFDLQKLLEMKETAFSAISQARKESAVFCGADAFAKMPFDAMYQMGSMDDPAYEIGIRQAELLHRRIVSTGISYMEQGLYIAKIPKVADATVLQVQVRIEHHLMAFRNFSLVQMELL